jgi:hypothetical protein
VIHHFQVWLIEYIRAHHGPVAEVMRTAWGWPIAESAHFIGLCLLIGSIGAFDLRLLGLMKRVPIAAMHRFIPFGIAGFVINICSGLLFFLTEPDQYVLNSSFHLKLMFLTIAGLNAGTFYLTSWRTVFGNEAVYEAPRRAKVIAAVSLSAWVAVIICGRMLTFFRPFECDPNPTQILLTCTPEELGR